jgi:hypothetical protein
MYYIYNYHNFEHYPLFSPSFKKHDITTEFCLHLQVEPAQLGPMERASLCLRTPAAL